MSRVPRRTFSEWFWQWVEDFNRWLAQLTLLFVLLRLVIFVSPFVLVHYGAHVPEWIKLGSIILSVLSFLSFAVQLASTSHSYGKLP
jgi:hypothetical protein